MKLYYSTITGINLPQTKKELSLGGYKSSTAVPNARIDNLFGDISQLSIERRLDKYIALFLVNETGVGVTGITLWFEYPIDTEDNQTNICKFEIAGTLPNINNQIETIQTRYDSPFIGTFYECDGETNAVSLGNLDIDKSIGLWIKRSFIEERLALINDNQSIYDEFTSNIKPITTEDISMCIKWD